MRCFVEIDRDRPVKTWREKIRAYHAYTNSPELKARYGANHFILLTITTTDTQRRKLMEATAQVLGQVSDRYLFSLIDDAHSATIGPRWRKITHVTPTTQKVPGNTYAVGVAIETAIISLSSKAIFLEARLQQPRFSFK